MENIENIENIISTNSILLNKILMEQNKEFDKLKNDLNLMMNDDLIMVIDTETTGLPKMQNYNVFFPYKQLDKYDTSRLVQMSWAIYNSKGEYLVLQDYIVNPNDFIIPNYAIKIHGISNTIAYQKGIEINDIFNILKKNIMNVKYFVAHNVNFDKNIILSELYRNKRFDIIKIMDKINYICTQDSTINLLKLPSIKYKYKKPKLSELYHWCFKEEMQNAHNSKYDTLNLARIFFYLRKNYNLYEETKI